MSHEHLIQFLGRHLLRLSQAVYPFPDVQNDGPLELEFSDRSVLVFDLKGDGQSVAVSLAPLEFPAPELDRQVWGRKSIDAPHLVGKFVTRIDALVEKMGDGESVAAYRVWLGPSCIYFANNGDSTVVSIDEIPGGFEESWVIICEVNRT
jgi:hypothetical protein